MTCRRPLVLLPLLALVAGTTGVACGGDDADPFTEVRRVEAVQATALAVDPAGDLLVGERRTGRIRSVDPATGEVGDERTIAGLGTDLAQGGLLGLVVHEGQAVAAYTADDGRITVGAVAPDGAVTVRWSGPEAQEEANGGRLVVAGGRLVIGIGDLLDPKRSPDPTTPNGKLLALAADGTTTVVADGFNNPFALAVGDEGDLWVADNAPGSRDEALHHLTPREDDGPVATWTDTRVPTGIAVVDDDHVAICNFATAELRLVTTTLPIEDDLGELLADDCRYGVVALPGGGLAYAAEDEVVVLDPA